MGQREQLLQVFNEDRIYAHQVLFAHRHKDVTPEFHKQMLLDFYSDHPRVAEEAFRGGAKSTLIEECVILKALFREVVFPLFVGNSHGMACERLAAVKQELTNNDMLIELFGDPHGSVWAADEIVLSNGIKIGAVGFGQSMRGVKHYDNRPDLAVIDDLENEEMVATPEAILRTKRWLNGTLRPALDPKTGKIRMLGTPLHPNCLIEQLMANPEWKSNRFPICYIDENGVEQATWPERFPLAWVKNIREEYVRDGALTEFEQEYMCRSESAAMKPFKPEMIPTPAALKVTYMAKRVIVDPARTVNQKTSAQTGYAVESWLGNKLVVHEAFGAFHKPDEIIDTIFKLDEEHSPVEIAVEADGLEEFLMQPIRNEILKRGRSLPVIAIRAPKNKEVFISGLQPWFIAKEVLYVKDLPELNVQLLQFPKGKKDILNALAYAPRLRAGKPVYEDFNDDHVAEILELDPRRPVFLVMSSRPAMVGACLLQYIDGAVRIHSDWVREGPPVEVLQGIVEDAILTAGRKVELVAPMEQFKKYDAYGLPGAARAARFELKPGGSAAACQGNLKDYMRKTVRGEPGVLINMDARWSLNGFAGGYCRKLTKAGTLEDFPTDNQYRLVLEAIEAFIGWFGTMQDSSDKDPNQRYATTRDGRSFLTTLPSRQSHGR